MRQPVRFASQDGTDKKRVKAAVIHGDHQWLETYFQKNPAHLNTLMLQIGVADRSALCLQIATDHRDLATVELLLRLGANPLANPGPHISAFADACASRDVPMILLYLRMGANYLQPQSTTSASVLQECVERGWVAALVILLDHAKAHGTLKDILLHQLDQHGDNLLALACYKQKNLVALTLWIYAQQAGILKPVLTATTSQTERLPLHFAARDDDFHDLVALMLNEMRHSPVSPPPCSFFPLLIVHFSGGNGH